MVPHVDVKVGSMCKHIEILYGEIKGQWALERAAGKKEEVPYEYFLVKTNQMM